MKCFKSSLLIGFSSSLLLLTGAQAWGSPVIGIASPMPAIQEPQQQPAQPAAAQSKTFTGTIVKDGEQYMLRDGSGAVYKLDDASKASAFEGKQVVVSGKLDAETKLIHVDSIVGASA